MICACSADTELALSRFVANSRAEVDVVRSLRDSGGSAVDWAMRYVLDFISRYDEKDG